MAKSTDVLRADALTWAKGGPPQTVSASLQSPSEKSDTSTDTLRPPAPDGFYVIVGRGMAATVNLATLVRTDWGIARLRCGVTPKPPILFVGFEDPWLHYDKHQMGQFPNLLGLPTYPAPVPTEDSFKEPMVSKTFAAHTKSQYGTLKSRYDCAELPAFVVLVQQYDSGTKGKAPKADLIEKLKSEEGFGDDLQAALDAKYLSTYPKLRLVVAFPPLPDSTTPQIGLVYAHRIDVCTGIGRARSPDKAVVGDKFAAEARGRLWESPETWTTAKRERLVMTGVDGLFEETRWDNTNHVCVMGAGGVAVNMVERARDERSQPWVDWLATKTLHASFVNPRNDPLLYHPSERRAYRINEFERDNTSAAIVPASALWRFGQGTKIKKVAQHESVRSLVNVEFTPSGEKLKDTDSGAVPSSMRDRELRETVPRNEPYYRVIFCTGLDPRALGQPEHVLSCFTMKAIKVDEYGLLGMQSSDEDVRALGRGGSINENWTLKAEADKTKEWQASVPVPAIPDGFTLNSLRVALANQYFGAKGDTHAYVNTLPEALLTARTTAELAALVVLLRRDHPEGVRSLDTLRAQLLLLRRMFTGFDATTLTSKTKVAERATATKDTVADDACAEVVDAVWRVVKDTSTKGQQAAALLATRAKAVPESVDLSRLAIGYPAPGDAKDR